VGFTYGGGVGARRFIVTAGSGQMAHSVDGRSPWTNVPPAANSFGSSHILTVIWGNDRFVAGSSHGRVAYSFDGTSWTGVNLSSIFGTGVLDRVESITYGNGTFIAVGTNGKMAYSPPIAADWPDATKWIGVSHPPEVFDHTNGDKNSINGIAFGAGRFVAVGNSGKIAYSVSE
jgi:hypothetical protein